MWPHNCIIVTAAHVGLQIFNIVVLSVIIAPHNVLTPHISKTHLPIVSLHERELELNGCSKDQSRKKGGPLRGTRKPNSIPQSQQSLMHELK